MFSKKGKYVSIIKVLIGANLLLACLSLCYAQDSRSAPIEVIKDSKAIIKENNIKIPINNENEAIRYAKALPVIKEYTRKYDSMELGNIKCSSSKFLAVFKKETGLWVVSVIPDHHCVVDSWREVEFPPDCSYTNIYPGMGG